MSDGIRNLTVCSLTMGDTSSLHFSSLCSTAYSVSNLKVQSPGSLAPGVYTFLGSGFLSISTAPASLKIKGKPQTLSLSTAPATSNHHPSQTPINRLPLSKHLSNSTPFVVIRSFLLNNFTVTPSNANNAPLRLPPHVRLWPPILPKATSLLRLHG
jgi:hypothetical protein